MFGGRLAAETKWIVAFPIGAPVSERQRIEVGGETLEVTAVSDLATYQAEIYVAVTDVD